jgi:hypothetical protein
MVAQILNKYIENLYQRLCKIKTHSSGEKDQHLRYIYLRINLQNASKILNNFDEMIQDKPLFNIWDKILSEQNETIREFLI